MSDALNKKRTTRKRVRTLRGKQKNTPPQALDEIKPLDVVTLLSLPDQLRKTALILLKLGRASAAMVAGETGRKKDAEETVLRQLVEMGYVRMEQTAHEVYFYV